jgi:hypothetical protein
MACYATSPTPGFARRCGNVAGSVQLTGARALAVVPSTQYATALNDLLADIARERAAGRRRLAEAVSADGQAQAAGALAVTYARARRSTLDLPVPAAGEEANAAIADALGELVGAYETAFQAVRRRHRGLRRSADRAVTRGEASLRTAVTQLAELGYDVT